VSARILSGDCRETLRSLLDNSVHCVVTSPPYWGLRDYGHPGQLGLEATPQEYVERMVQVFREVRRVLAEDGTLWLNLGDTYAGSWGAQSRPNGTDAGSTLQGGSRLSARQIKAHPCETGTGFRKNTPGLKTKDLVGIPWRVAFALQSDGWWLRQDIIWSKPNPMPESVRDRCTKAHEYLFLLTKSERYFFDADAIKEPAAAVHNGSRFDRGKTREAKANHVQSGKRIDDGTRNRRDVWSIASHPYNGAHFAVMPPALVEPCILAGSREGDIVLDPFGGSGTVGMVANWLGRDSVLCELNPEYVALIEQRVRTPRKPGKRNVAAKNETPESESFYNPPLSLFDAKGRAL
jgi:DNA modification methylase